MSVTQWATDAVLGHGDWGHGGPKLTAISHHVGFKVEVCDWKGCGHALWRDAIAHQFVSWRICQLTSSSLKDKLNLALLISRSLKPHWGLVLFLAVSINKYVLSGKSVMYLFKVRLTDSFISRSSASIHHCIRNCKPIFSTSIMILFLPFQPLICQISLILSKLSFLK